MSEQTYREKKNPPDLLKRVYDIFFTAHISLSPRLNAKMKMMM